MLPVWPTNSALAQLRKLHACTGYGLSALWFWGHPLFWNGGKIE